MKTPILKKMAGRNCRGAEREEKEFCAGILRRGRGRTRVVECEPLRRGGSRVWNLDAYGGLW